MLSQELRPFDFSEMAGQKENIRILKAILKDPDNAPKCLIFQGAYGSGKTTASRILARKLNNITDRNFDLLSSPFYYEFDSTVVGNVEEIRRLRDMFTVSYGEYWRVVILDECLHGDSYVILADGTYRKIKDIVNNRESVIVRSYNIEKDKVENKRVVGWFRNSPKQFYKVRFEKQKGTVFCSDNHRFITDKGEVRLKDLSVGDKVLRDEPSLSEEQKSFLIGTLLGDSTIYGTKGRPFACPRVTMTQGYAQKNWIELKVSVFKNIISEEIRFSKENEKKYNDGFDNRKPVAQINTRSVSCLKEIEDLILDPKTKKKVVSRRLLNKLTPAGIAAWYMDDGQRYDTKYKGKKKISRVNIHTSGFSEEEQDIICKYFEEVWGIGFRRVKPMGYWFITTKTVGDTKKFYNLIAPEMVDGVLDYKLPQEFKRGNGILNIPKGRDVTPEKITKIEKYGNKLCDSYDIEVEDNHNYFAGGILVHNCHAISNAAQNALLKMLEETTGRTMYIMCTTEVKKLLPTIRSRSLELQFNPVPIDEIVKNLTQVSENRQLNLSEEIKYLIAERSGGHMRNAHMLLDKYLLLGDKDFKDSIKSAITLYCNYLIAIYQNDKDKVLEYINDLLNIPKDNLQIDWNMVMTESLKSFCGMEVAHEDVKRMVKVYGSKFSLVSSCYMAQWMKNAFIDMPYFQATMLNMYIVLRGALGSSEQSKVTTSPGNANRFGRPVR